MSKSRVNPDFPMIELAEGRHLCSTFQWAVVETSFPEMIEKLTPARLKSNITSAKKFRQDAGKGRAAQLFKETLDRFEVRLKLFENADLRGQAVIGVFEKEAPDKQSFHTHDIEIQAESKFEERRKSSDLSSIAVHGEQQGAKAGERRVQSHIGSANRRRQAKRDTRNR